MPNDAQRCPMNGDIRKHTHRTASEPEREILVGCKIRVKAPDTFQNWPKTGK